MATRLVPGLQPGIAPSQETYGVAIGYSGAAPLALSEYHASRLFREVGALITGGGVYGTRIGLFASTVAAAFLLLASNSCAAGTPATTGSSTPAPTAAPVPRVTGVIPGRILAGGSGKVFILGPDGLPLWTQRARLVHDAWMLPNGNVLYADEDEVAEVDPHNKIIFRYKPAEQRGGAVFACQRLANGNTLAGENSTGRVLELAPDGKIVFQLQTAPFQAGGHQNMRMVRKLENGNYLVCQSGAHLVKEYQPDGKVVLEIKTPNLAFAALRTSAGTTLVSTLDHLLEYDAAGRVVWQFSNQELPGVTITNMTGMHLLADGSVAVGCYAAYTKTGEGTGLFQITRDRHLVWRFVDPKAGSSLMAIQCLDPQGKLLYGTCLR